jgi:hypothetical protein
MLLSFQPWKERHPLTHGMFPVATGSGGPSGLEDSPQQPSRAKTGNARSPGRERKFSSIFRKPLGRNYGQTGELIFFIVVYDKKSCYFGFYL